MLMKVLEEHSMYVFTSSWKMEAVCADQNLGTHPGDYTGEYNFES
jgi:hypothetical protein